MASFGRHLEFEDIYQHVTSPDVLFLLIQEERIAGMASYNKRIFSGFPALIAEGIALHPEVQGKGFFGTITGIARNGEPIVALRTQNPRMYRALEKICSSTYPCIERETPEAISAIMKEFAQHLGCQIDHQGVIKGYYGGLFYGQKPEHQQIMPLFEKIGLDMDKGDGLVAIGIYQG